MFSQRFNKFMPVLFSNDCQKSNMSIIVIRMSSRESVEDVCPVLVNI